MLINRYSLIIYGEHSHHITKNNGRKSVVTTRYILYVLTNPSPWRLLIRTWIIVNKHKSYETTCQCRRRNGFTEVWFQISTCHILAFHHQRACINILYIYQQEALTRIKWRILKTKYHSNPTICVWGICCAIALRRMSSDHTAEKSTLCQLTHWGRDKMAAVSQTIFSHAFAWMKMYEFGLRFHGSLFLRDQLTITLHWFR